ncbi:MAG: class I SAM-dependent methyltransferase [Eubacteriaceae bacterium]|nr:class I SAM-dependent methyltransferase [Eubacteriaceae bacterium]
MKNIPKETAEKLVRSLSWETTDLLPFLPYLLQDFWELGSDPDLMVNVIKKYIIISGATRILDLACGKGAVAVKVAQKLQARVKGIDLVPEFIEYGMKKAKEFGVEGLCEFVIDDINEAVKTEKDYDCVIFGAAGVDILGGPMEALSKLKATVKQGGYILIEEGYIPNDGRRENIRYNSDNYFPLHYWLDLFDSARLELVESASGHSEGSLDSETGLAAITARANELIEKYPDKKELFEGYVRNQENEYADLDDSLATVTWVLKKL